MDFEEIRNVVRGLAPGMPDEDRLVLYEEAKKLRENSLIVDIGTGGGNSALIFALASLPSVKIITIDPVKNLIFLDLVEKLNLREKIRFLHVTSKDAFKKYSTKVDLLFIDGEHTYAGVKSDLETWGAKVKKGCPILIHDYLLYRNTIGYAVDEFIGSMIEVVRILDDDIAKQHNTPVGMVIAKKI